MQIKSIFTFLTVCAVLAQFNYMMTQDVRPDGCILAPASGFFYGADFLLVQKVWRRRVRIMARNSFVFRREAGRFLGGGRGGGGGGGGGSIQYSSIKREGLYKRRADTLSSNIYEDTIVRNSQKNQNNFQHSKTVRFKFIKTNE